MSTPVRMGMQPDPGELGSLVPVVLAWGQSPDSEKLGYLPCCIFEGKIKHRCSPNTGNQVMGEGDEEQFICNVTVAELLLEVHSWSGVAAKHATWMQFSSHPCGSARPWEGVLATVVMLLLAHVLLLLSSPPARLAQLLHMVSF